jgi:hypothetical protein
MGVEDDWRTDRDEVDADAGASTGAGAGGTGEWRGEVLPDESGIEVRVGGVAEGSGSEEEIPVNG